jgi:hypothetical protein
MSKRGSKSAEFIGSFLNRTKHAPEPRPRSPDWAMRAVAFVRHAIREGQETLSDAREAPLAPRKLKEARVKLDRAAITLESLRNEDHQAAADLTMSVIALLRQLTEVRPRSLAPRKRRRRASGRRTRGQDLVRCDDCNRLVRSAHKSVECDPDLGLVPCSQCGQFVRRDRLEEHSRRHRSRTPKGTSKSRKKKKNRKRLDRAIGVGTTTETRDLCMATTSGGSKCSRTATHAVRGGQYCAQHAALRG